MNDMPAARDEYDGYIYGVFRLLVDGASDEEIAKHLLRIIHERMEITQYTYGQMLPTVKALREIQL